MVSTEELDQIEIAKKLRARRESLGLTQKEAAEKAGVSHRTYQRAEDETGAERADAGRLTPIARALGVPLTELIQGPIELFEKPAKLELLELAASLDNREAELLLSAAKNFGPRPWVARSSAHSGDNSADSIPNPRKSNRNNR